VVAWSHESIVSKVATDICLNDFATDSVTRDEIFILTLRACLITACHNVRGMEMGFFSGYRFIVLGSKGPEKREIPEW
jgi:hypothetical protein